MLFRSCLDAATVPFESARLVLADMLAAQRAGLGDEDFAALVTAVEERCGMALV